MLIKDSLYSPFKTDTVSLASKDLDILFTIQWAADMINAPLDFLLTQLSVLEGYISAGGHQH